MSGPDAGRHQIARPGASVARVADPASVRRSNRGPANTRVGAAIGSRPHAGPPAVTPDMVRHLQRSAGNSATAGLLQQRGMVVARQDARAGADPGAAQKGTKEYNERAAESAEPGPLPGGAVALLRDRVSQPGKKTVTDLSKGWRWALGHKKINIPVTLPGLGVSAGIGGSVDAGVNIAGQLNADWKRDPLGPGKAGQAVIDKISLQGGFNANAAVAGGIFGYFGLSAAKVAEVHVTVGGRAELTGSGSVNVSGMVERRADPLAAQWGAWNGNFMVDFKFTGELIVVAAASLEWRVLLWSGEERLFTLGRVNAGKVTAAGKLAVPPSGTPKFDLTASLEKAERHKAELTETRKVDPPRPGSERNVSTPVSALRVQRAPGPDEERADPAAALPAGPPHDAGAAGRESVGGAGAGLPVPAEESHAAAQDQGRAEAAKQQAAATVGDIGAGAGMVVSELAPSEGDENHSGG